MTVFIPREAVAPALSRPDIGRALPLYLDLLVHALAGGTVIRTRERLAEDLAVSEADIDDLLGRLERAGLIELRSPAPFLAIRLRFWPGRRPRPRPLPPADALSLVEVPVGSSSKQQHAAAFKQFGDRGPGEGVPLATEAAGVLGVAAENAELAALLSAFPEPLIRRALTRVRATPMREIRKSRLALFRYLLAKLSDESLTHAR
jgi:hypothetical protein